jgi:hypothetical protein
MRGGSMLNAADVVLLLFAAFLLCVATASGTALLRPQGRLDAAVSGGVVGTILVVAAVALTGAAGALRPLPLLAMHALQACCAVGLLARRGDLQRPARALPHWSQVRAHAFEASVVGFAALALGWQVMVALVLPPYAYDALSYHLLTVATWVQSGTLAPSAMNLCCAYYPANADLLTAWPMVLTHSDALAGLVQVLAALLGAVSTAGIARTAGLGRAKASAAGAIFVLTPALLAQAPTSYVDVLLAAWVLAALHGLARFAATARPSRLAVPAMSAGLLAGTKGTGPMWAVAVGFLVVGLCWWHVRAGRLSRRLAGIAVLGTATVCGLLGGWWYVRSARDTGNPVYPFNVTVAGVELFEGPLKVAEVLTPPDRGAGALWPVAVLASWASDLLPWRHGSYEYQQRSGGLGPFWAWLGGPLLIPMLALLWRQRSAALVGVLPVLAVLLIQPYRWWARFTLPLAAVGALAVLIIDSRCRSLLVRTALRAATLVLVLLGAGLVLVEVNPASRARPLPARDVLALLSAPAHERTLGRLFFPEYRFLDEVPSDALVVADVAAPPLRFVTPLFGRDLQRTVIPAGDEVVPSTAWVVTSLGRSLDVQMSATRPGPVADERGVRVWAPSR